MNIEGFYDEAVKFFKTFYGVTFKDNPYLEKTVITGVSRVAKESIFSGANNFKVYTVLDNEFADDFGITEEEMEKVIEDFEVQEDKEEIKRWYDGYKIGEVEGIYNPWSILNYLTDRKLMPYWVNTSSNDLIKLILKNSETVKENSEMDNTDNRPYWEYVAVLDSKTRPEHAQLHGLVYRYDDPFWASFYPPNGWRCRCRVNALSNYNLQKKNIKPSDSTGTLSQEMRLVSKKSGEYKPVTVYTDPLTGKKIAPDVGWSHNPASGLNDI